ncbi:MAG: hypothetical protein ACOYMR_03015 [Ilumatobacteraceae bacterium]
MQFVRLMGVVTAGVSLALTACAGSDGGATVTLPGSSLDVATTVVVAATAAPVSTVPPPTTAAATVPPTTIPATTVPPTTLPPAPPAQALMPNVVCMNLQDAQDYIQTFGVFFSRSVDATGQDRMQLIDSNWQVVDQFPAPGTPFGEGDAVLSVVKIGEVPNPC